MRRLLALLPSLLLAAPFPVSAGAQPHGIQDETALRRGESIAAELGEAGEQDRYTFEAEADSFLLVRIEQIDVDVVARILDPEGKPKGTVDQVGRGPETVAVVLMEAGSYTLEVSGFEQATGRYQVELLRLEAAQTDPAKLTDQRMSAYAAADSPGAAVQVWRDGQTVFSRAYGCANLAHEVPFAVDTRTNIGSTSKQFTAFAVLLEAEHGALSLDDDIRQHIPELPEFEHPITVRHLLSHTSGLREFLNLLVMSGRRLDHGDWIDRGELIEVVQRQPALQNVPGQEFNYNNTAFGLAALIVERTSGMEFHQYMEEKVFAPLGMTRSMVRPTPKHIVPHSSEGYTPSRDGFLQIGDLGGAVGAGAIYASIQDLETWAQNYLEPRVGTRAMVDAMMTPYPVGGKAADTGYGLGLFIDEQRGLRRVHHGGADVAHRSMLVIYPEIQAGLTVQSNHAAFDSAIAFELAEAFFADAMDPDGLADADATAGAAEDAAEDADFDASTYDPEDFDQYVGRYALDANPAFILDVTRDGETFSLQATGQPAFEITPRSPTRFRPSQLDAEIEFLVDEEGVVEGLNLHQNGKQHATRLSDDEASWKPSADQLEAYVGRYFCPEIETFYELVIEDETLAVRHRRLDDFDLTPGIEDQFTGSNLQFEFERDRHGHILGFYLANGRTRDVRFERVR